MKKLQYICPEIELTLAQIDTQLLAGSGGAALSDNTNGSGSGSEDGGIIKIGEEGIDPDNPGDGGGWARYDAWATWDDMGWE